MIDLERTLFNINVDSTTPREGSLLVAEPFLHEDYFNHAVIALVDHRHGGESMGIVMNRTTGYTLGELIDDLDDNIGIPVFCGGPMSCDRLFYMHTMGPLFSDSRQVTDDLYIGGDFDEVMEYVRAGYPTDRLIRFFVGYSGWDAGQLEKEMKRHVWAVADAMPASKMLAGGDDAYWHKVVRTMGTDYRGWLYHPMNPAAN